MDARPYLSLTASGQSPPGRAESALRRGADFVNASGLHWSGFVSSIIEYLLFLAFQNLYLRKLVKQKIDYLFSLIKDQDYNSNDCIVGGGYYPLETIYNVVLVYLGSMQRGIRRCCSTPIGGSGLLFHAISRIYQETKKCHDWCL